ncbi:hypothetical protein BDR07DRAFT_1459969 [Suillus spraguei]|nr:hypothetical protein BDR07DRAFT_1465719 [Suillus spraguei]KAG2364067.1 hypothetical protein BDR07DRAFT_1459969 [Suillus spraguei]
MRFSSATVLAAVIALASSPISAMPADAAANACPYYCSSSKECSDCPVALCVGGTCLSMTVGTDAQVISEIFNMLSGKASAEFSQLAEFSFDWEMLERVHQYTISPDILKELLVLEILYYDQLQLVMQSSHVGPAILLPSD